MKYNFPYLQDSAFLKEFDKNKLKQQYVKLIVLSFDEKPIGSIQGRVTGGGINLDGSSAMRRTASLSLVASGFNNDLTTTKNLLSINKKVEVLIGFINTSTKYTQYPIIWFPQGVFVIITPNISHDQNGVNISLTLHDKMALLNGQCGGTLPASVNFSQIEQINQDGERVVYKPTIYQIIQQLVNHFGGEQLGKIIISDVENKIKQVMKWTGTSPLYEMKGYDAASGIPYYTLTLNQAQIQTETSVFKATGRVFNYGEDVGYSLTDFVYPGQLIGNAGDTVVTILDKIRDVLGNYEYFYDINGNFIFQQIKNYLNNSFSTLKINELNSNNYVVDYAKGKSVYSFDDAELVMSYSNSPQFQQIKNDFVIWGKRKTVSGQEIPIRYHLAIDKKPNIGNIYKVFFYDDPDDNLIKAVKPLSCQILPQSGQPGKFYLCNDIIYKWNPQLKSFEETSYEIQNIKTTDYRSELYLDGINAQPFGLSSNYYFTELRNEWTKLYNLQDKKDDDGNYTGAFYPQTLENPSEIDFFLDFIDSSAAISEFSVSNIGRRTLTIVDDKINCLFEPTFQDVIMISQSDTEARQQCLRKGQSWIQVSQQIYKMLFPGGTLRSAYEEIRKQLYMYTNYNEQVSLTTIPIYYLQPNERISIKDPQSAIYGDYMIKTISLPLGVGGTMSLSCTKALERI